MSATAPSAYTRPAQQLAGKWLVALGLIGLVIGFIVGFIPVGDNCGKALAPDTSVAELTDTLLGSNSFTRRCNQELQHQAVGTWVALALGTLLLLTGIILWVTSRTRIPGTTLNTAGPTTPPLTTTQRLATLDQLRATNSITEDEYTTQRAKILTDI